MTSYSTILLRLGVAFAFIYPPLDSLAHPNAWIGFFPHFMLGYVPDNLMLIVWGVIEIILALWILSNKKIAIPSTLATILLLLIVAFNFSLFEIVFRDLAIAAMSATLAWQSFAKEKRA